MGSGVGVGVGECRVDGTGFVCCGLCAYLITKRSYAAAPRAAALNRAISNGSGSGSGSGSHSGSESGCALVLQLDLSAKVLWQI